MIKLLHQYAMDARIGVFANLEKMSDELKQNINN